MKKKKIQTIVTHLFNDDTSEVELITYNEKGNQQNTVYFNKIDKNQLIKQAQNENLVDDDECINNYIQRLLEEDLKYASDRTKQILLVILIIEKLYKRNNYIHDSKYPKFEDDYYQNEYIDDPNFEKTYEKSIEYVSHKLEIQNTTVKNKLTQQINLQKNEIQTLIKYYLHEKDARTKIDLGKGSQYNLKEYLEIYAPAQGYKLEDKNVINKFLRSFVQKSN